ncbi:helix-turn-helix transcriptional regulator [Marinibactrum halimedae]|uniref:helix-turn-helix transcriptional regulator n=1 Tax=Marinibactrum halimedae TaxID=1444977 RepID=UPI001E64E859
MPISKVFHQDGVWHVDDQDLLLFHGLYGQWEKDVDNTHLTLKGLALLKVLLLFIEEKLEWLGSEPLSLRKHWASTTEATSQRNVSRLLPLLKHMEATHYGSISLEEAAQICGISKFHFSRMFKSVFQQSFQDYMLRQRILTILPILGNKDISIAEVAYQAGFSDSSHFCKRFKLIMNQTPGEFRKLLKRNSEFSRQG